MLDARFTGPLDTAQPKHADRTLRHRRLALDFGFYSSRGLVVARKGFNTDGCSTPRALWSYEPPWGEAAGPAVLHDFLYWLLRCGTPHPAAPTRRDADAIFYEALIAWGVPPGKACTLWLGVRIFGHRPGSFHPSSKARFERAFS